MRKLHIKKGDNVFVNSGEDKGKTGRVLEVNPSKETAIVEGVNFITRRTKPNATNPQGGMVKREAPVHISKLNPVDPDTQKPTRIHRQKDDNGRTQRVAKSGKVLD